MTARRLTCSFAPSRFVLRVVGKHWITAEIRAVRGSTLGAPPVDGAKSGQGGAASKGAAAEGAAAGKPADGPMQLSELDTPGAGAGGAADEHTLLMCAAEAGLMRAVKTLIRMRADVSARDAAGATAAEIASAVRARPPPPLPSRTKWTRLVPPPVLIGHVRFVFGAPACPVAPAAAPSAQTPLPCAWQRHGTRVRAPETAP